MQTIVKESMEAALEKIIQRSRLCPSPGWLRLGGKIPRHQAKFGADIPKVMLKKALSFMHAWTFDAV